MNLKQRSFLFIAGSIFAFLFIVGATSPPPAPPLAPPEPPLPQGIPSDLLQKPSWSARGFQEVWGGLILNVYSDEDSVIVVYDDRNFTLRVSFKEIATVTGIWTGSNAALKLRGPCNATFTAKTQTKTWGDILWGETKNVKPWLEVTPFSLNKNWLHNWVEAEASMYIRYPMDTGFSTFVNREAFLVRSFRFFVISSEDYKMLQAHNDWEGAYEAWERSPKSTEEMRASNLRSSIVFGLLGAILIYPAVKRRLGAISKFVLVLLLVMLLAALAGFDFLSLIPKL